ncbi:MAG: C4-type zinc ribbon domain-containing protein [Desulfobacterales bacterium]
MDEELKKKFDNLVKLQEVEIESASVQARLADFPRLLTDLDDRLKASEGAVTLEAGRLSEIQQAYRVQEADAKVIQARIVKSEEKLRSVKTNKEYQSSLKEIDDLKGSLSAVEDRMLAYLDEMDQVAVSVATKKDEVKLFSREIEEEKEQIRQSALSAQQQLDCLNDARAKIIAVIEPDLLKIYETVKKNSGGVAIAVVKNAVCLGCHVNLPPQMFHDLLHFDKLLVCPHCERLIYPATE